MNIFRFRIHPIRPIQSSLCCMKLQNSYYNDPRLRTVSTHISEEQTETLKEEEDVDLIEKKRNKSRMGELYHKRHIKKELGGLVHFWEYKPHILKKYYGTYGKGSGLNPGIMWPTKEELRDMIEFEREFETPAQELIRNVQEAKRLEKEARRKREEEILAKVAKLDTWIKDFKDKEMKKLAAAEAQREKRERIIEEVREYLGYSVSPQDPKFQEVLEQRELEEKKAKKAAKRKDRKDKLMAQLLAFSESGAQSSDTTEAASKTTEAAASDEKEETKEKEKDV